MYLEYFKPSEPVRDTYLYLAVKPASAAKRRVNRIGAVRCCNHHHLPPRFQPVHKREQLSDHAPLHFARDLLSLRGDAIYLVYENDSRRRLFGFIKDLTDLLFTLAVVFAHYLGAAYRGEIRIGLVRNSLRYHCFSCTWRPVQKNSFRRVYAQLLEKFRMSKRKFYHLPYQSDLTAQSPDILISYMRGAHFQLFHDLFFHDDAGGSCHNNRP
ncbi:Uncharacterised protein [uncultured archaeon]|nr:Uncharacterised protein [uncultured archaeon]